MDLDVRPKGFWLGSVTIVTSRKEWSGRFVAAFRLRWPRRSLTINWIKNESWHPKWNERRTLSSGHLTVHDFGWIRFWVGRYKR